MENLRTDWETVQGILQGIEGLDTRALRRYYEEGPAKAGIHFFLIRYEPDEVIVAKGTTSDYAAVHVQGLVKVRDVVTANRKSGHGCWQEPLRRRLENLVLEQTRKTAGTSPRGRWLTRPLAAFYRSFPGVVLGLMELCESCLPVRVAEILRHHLTSVLHGRFRKVRRPERELSRPASAASPSVLLGLRQPIAEKVHTVRDETGQPLPVAQRFMGIASTLWNQVRSVTLVADNDPGDDSKPCIMLLIKRKALEEIVKGSPRFYERKMTDFIEQSLPAVLARNRLFRDRLFVDDVLDWTVLGHALRGQGSQAAAAWLVPRLDRKLVSWLARNHVTRLDGPGKTHLVEQLNRLLCQRDLFPSGPWCGLPLCKEAATLRNRLGSLNDCESFRLNRLLLSAVLPGVFVESRSPSPLSREDFQEFSREISLRHQQKYGQLLKPDRLEKRQRGAGQQRQSVFRQGDPADCLYLVLTGMVRVSVNLPGGRTMVNNLEEDSSFGEAALLGTPDDMARRTADVETLCNSTLLRLDRDILQPLLAGTYRSLGEKLRREHRMFTSRDEHMRSGHLLPPIEPPQEIAERLMLTRNALLIDMNQCTRCDQCVRACADAHDGQPRFHRANPDLRFGKWEIAAACLHCLDSPCQQVCPVGAITLLEDMAVQVHRDRCIGCSQCAVECPFGVVDMYLTTSPHDAPSSRKGIVASKCDLCLTEEHDPPCVASCPYDAALRVDPMEFFADLKGWANFADRTS